MADFTEKFATPAQVMAYIASCAESIIEDDLNEDGEWSEAAHDNLVERALSWCHSQYLELEGEE